jgi:hypothetical protein
VDRDGEVDEVSNSEVYIDLRGADISGSGGISGIATNHDNLLNRDVIDSHPASAISYDGSASGLSATTIPGAIDELKALIDNL